MFNSLQQKKVVCGILDQKGVIWCVKQMFYFSSIISILTLITSIYSIQVLDRVLSTGSINTLIWLTILCLVCHFFIRVLTQKRSNIMFRIAEDLKMTLGKNFFITTIVKDTKNNEKIVKTITTFESFFVSPQGFVNLCDALWSIVFLLSIYGISWKNGLITTLSIFTIIWYSIINDFLRAKDKNLTANSNNMYLSNLIYNRFFIIASNLIRRCKDNFMNKFFIDSENKIKLHYNSNLNQNIIAGIKIFFQTMLFASSAYQVVHGQMTSGGIIATSILYDKAFSPHVYIKKSIESFREFINVNIRNVFMFIDKEIKLLQNPESSITIENFDIHMDKVHVANQEKFYVEENRYIINNADLIIPAGSIVAVLGNSGSGKTALLKTIGGAFTTVFGSVKIGGHNIYSLILDKDLDFISYYFSNSIFDNNETIAKNISRFSENPNIETIIAICKANNVNDFILSLKDDYNAKVDFSLLPESRKRQLLISRAFYGLPKIILLENPFSGFDTNGQQGLLHLINAAKQNNSTIIIESSDDNILQICDRVIIIKDGGIVVKYEEIKKEAKNDKQQSNIEISVENKSKEDQLK